MITKSKKALVFFNSFTETIGGSEYLVFTIIKALQERYSITVALNDDFLPIRRAASIYGVDIDWTDITVIDLSPHGILAKLDRRLKFIRKLRLRKLGRSFDICISCANIVDFGRPGIHFVYMMTFDPWFQEWAQGWTLNGLRKIRHELVAVRDFFSCILSRTRVVKQILNNPQEVVLANSAYVRKKVEDYYSCHLFDVFYPPTIFHTSVPNVSDQLHIGYLGRICDEKRVKELIHIVYEARLQSGLNLEFYVGGVVLDDAYGHEITALAHKYSWLKLCGAIVASEKAKFLSSISIALHGRCSEEFGISITEYLKAGIVPVVPKDGGPSEIVGFDELCFTNYNEAVQIITRLVHDSLYFEHCKRFCLKRGLEFSAEKYWLRQSELLKKLGIL